MIGVAYAAVEVRRRFLAPVTDSPPSSLTATGPPIKDLADALRELLTALAAAPVWLALMGVGVFAFWVARNAIPAKCEAADTYKTVETRSQRS